MSHCTVLNLVTLEETIDISDTYISKWFNVRYWRSLELNLITSKKSKNNGVSVQFSNDGIEPVSSINFTQYAHTFAQSRQFQLNYPFVRLVFINESIDINSVKMTLKLYSE